MASIFMKVNELESIARMLEEVRARRGLSVLENRAFSQYFHQLHMAKKDARENDKTPQRS